MRRHGSPDTAVAGWLAPPQLNAGLTGAMPVVAAAVMVAATEPMPSVPAAEPVSLPGAAADLEAPGTAGNVQSAGAGALRDVRREQILQLAGTHDSTGHSSHFECWRLNGCITVATRTRLALKTVMQSHSCAGYLARLRSWTPDPFAAGFTCLMLALDLLRPTSQSLAEAAAPPC